MKMLDRSLDLVHAIFNVKVLRVLLYAMLERNRKTIQDKADDTTTL